MSSDAAGVGPGEWSTAVAPIVNRCRVATTFHGHAVFDVDGAAALGELLTNMARLLDEAAARAALTQGKETE